MRIQPAEEIVERAEIRDHEVCLDIGSGVGYVAIPAAVRAAYIIALDAEREMLESLIKRVTGNVGDRVLPLIAELPDLPIKSETIDHVLAINVIHEIEEKERLSSEISRVLRKGGRLSVVDFHKKTTSFGPPLHERLSEEEMIAFFHDLFLLKKYSFDEFYQLEFLKSDHFP
ncbi:MAG: class I SAM-dependent methyltransferase [Methanomassiliicoccales archaeon]|jgi:ubiquinone/menaquinone biosynthesis C-methylase UbiE|nr:class I SAM-dependent methyltransferase [Methanomassiliicoccales archaeon]